MKKSLLLKSLVVMLFFCLPFVGNAQRLLTENFEYEEGNLYNQGGWVRYGSNSADSIRVINESLTYPDYQDAASGKAVELKSTISGEDLQKKFSDTGTNDAAVYAAALMKFKEVEAAEGKEAHFFTLVGKAAKPFSDGSSGTEYGKLYVKKGSADGKFKIGVSRFNFNIEYAPGEYDLSTTYLIVMKYEVVEGTNNDKVFLFINPAASAAEPAADACYDGFSGSDLNLIRGGFEAVELRQGSTAARTSPNVVIDAVRISQSWDGLFTTGPVEEKPVVAINPKSVVFGSVFAGGTYTSIINVKAQNLKGDITISGLTTGEVSTSAAVIPKDEAQSEKGYDLTVTLQPASEYIYSDEVIFGTEGMTAPVTANVIWAAKVLTEVADLKALREKNPADWATYRLTGGAVISHIYKDDGKAYYYLQDGERGITVYDAFGDIKESYKAGDEVKGVTGTLDKSFGSLFLIPSDSTLGEKISSGNEIAPVVVTLQELSLDSIYESRLIKVENVVFEDAQVGAAFQYLSNPAINDGTAEAKMRVFKDADYIGETIPREAALIGISTSGYGNLIAPRTSADILPKQKLEVTPGILEKKTTQVGEPVELGKLKILTQGLPGPVLLDVRGTDRSFFTASATSIPAGKTNMTEVTIAYQPTAAGMHKATLVIDCEEAPELSKTISLAGNAFDPADMPEFTVDAASLTGFTAVVGEQHEQKVLVTTKSLLDWLGVKVMGEGEKSFQISTTIMMKNQENAPLKITFKPKKAGTFTERIEFKTEGVEPFYLTVTGTAAEKTKPQPEGDDFVLDPSNPVVLLNEKFENAVHNKVLAVPGWKTIAVEGPRAWWGYDFKDEDDKVVEKTAKVTAYSSTTEETPAHEMWLVTPALDFVNSQSKMFTFRVMGDLLVEGQDAVLTVHYMDMAEGTLYTSPIEMDLPSVPDDNKEWREYHMDLSGQDIADVFFIGFHFKAAGGSANSAVYYIDDVTYGRTDIPVITPSAAAIEFTAGLDAPVSSDVINVAADNLSEPVSIAIGGADKSRFKASANTLPAEGGAFSVTFSSDKEGAYEAYVKLSSRGAADVYIPMTAGASKESGMDDDCLHMLRVWSKADKVCISSDADMKAGLYTVSGVRIGEWPVAAGLNELPCGLDKGIYILQMNYHNQLINHKIIIE